MRRLAVLATFIGLIISSPLCGYEADNFFTLERRCEMPGKDKHEIASLAYDALRELGKIYINEVYGIINIPEYRYGGDAIARGFTIYKYGIGFFDYYLGKTKVSVLTPHYDITIHAYDGYYVIQMDRIWFSSSIHGFTVLYRLYKDDRDIEKNYVPRKTIIKVSNAFKEVCRKDFNLYADILEELMINPKREIDFELTEVEQ